jgi:pimeloyl-ACP methyl ester carboxylesterase
MTRKLIGAIGAVLMVVTAFATAASAAGGDGVDRNGGFDRGHRAPRPVVFVHGGSGSGAQFESQALRLAGNGYPMDRIAVHEYDSTFATNTMAEVWAGLDELIATLRTQTGTDKVDLLGHSLGTFVSQGYLASSPERAATVAHYVNIDGRPAAAPPGGVPTLAVWGEGDPSRQVVGATNWYAPDQSHVEVATSAETFAQFYEFFTGREPRTTAVVPERGRIRISGEANLFPANVGAAGTTLEVWKVDGDSGGRRGRRPVATFAIGEDGAWGPFRASRHQSYELALTRDDGSVHHFYFRPFVRSNHLVRLLTSEPGTGIDLLRDKSDAHTSLTITRYKELWGDQGEAGDVLTVDGHDVVTPALAPRAERINALFVFDDGSDGATDLTAPIPDVSALPFISGADLHLPATSPPDDTITVALRSRTGSGRTQVVNVPNWTSSQHHVSIQFPDFA